MESTAEAEFTAFVAGRGHALLKTAYALTGEQHGAEDLVQTALAKAFSRWSRISGEPEAYVKKIIYHDFVSGWRRRRRQPEIAYAEVPEWAASGGYESHTALRMLLRDALQALPPRQRAVLILRYIEDLSVEDTAVVLSCRPGTVLSQASRALAKLRELVPSLDGGADLIEVTR